MKIGIAGTGRMGAAIAGRLLNLGHEVTVWNRTAEKTKALAAAGAKVAATPAQFAAASEIFITILTNAAAIDAAYHGQDGEPVTSTPAEFIKFINAEYARFGEAGGWPARQGEPDRD